jgi:hypothetical protein
MKLLTLGAVLLAVSAAASGIDASLVPHVRALEAAGEAGEARLAVETALRAAPRDAATLEFAAHFADERRGPEARALYGRLAELTPAGEARRVAALRRLVELDLIAGERPAAAAHLAELRGLGADAPELPRAAQPVFPMGTIDVPGPLRGFARMAGLAPDVASAEMLPALARNVVTNGYQATVGGESLEQTEYLKLVLRYLSLARELDRFAGEKKSIRIESCDSAATGELLKILGFRLRGACGGDLALETVNASRAFLTMDSGFPLAKLEQALRTNQLFVYDFQPTHLPVVFGSSYWLSAKEKQPGEFIDAFLNDPAMCRLYLGLVQLDPETAELVRTAMPLARARAFAHVLDFFGGMFRVRDGVAEVPGGAHAAPAWAELAGVGPDKGVAFVERIVTRDDGWMASYFDSLSRINGPTLEYLVSGGRLTRYYAALRGKVTSPGPARPVFRANTDLLLLVTRLNVQDGRVQVPGSLAVWKHYIAEHPAGKVDAKLSKAAPGWKDPDDLVEGLFGLARKAVENEPLKIFLALSDLDRRRTKPLEAATVERLLDEYPAYGSQYAVLSEAPELSDAALLHYIEAARAIETIKENPLRADAAGLLQSLALLWQVLYRNHELPAARAESALEAIDAPFLRPKSSRSEIFDAGRTGVVALLSACGVGPTEDAQEKLLELLAGTLTPVDADTHTELVAELERVFDAQKLVGLKTLFDLDDQLRRTGGAAKGDAAALGKLAARVSNLDLPKPALSTAERSAGSFGYWSEFHIEYERKLNFRAQLDKAPGERSAELRGLLTPLLRDTLVGLVYAYYAPPGAQVLYANPIFVRSHEFIGSQASSQIWRPTELVGSGWPANAGGRLAGSLAGLPYALAEAEQNFLVPSREQALIWGDLVPQLLLGAKAVRWWNATPDQLHWVALELRLGEAEAARAAYDGAARARLLAVLDRAVAPGRRRQIEGALAGGDAAAALELITPAELYLAGLDAGETKETGGFLGAELARLAAADPEHCSAAGVAAQFGTPKPTLTHSYAPQLLHLRLFPTLMGYSSRLLAESWESNNLFFAALADELMLPPSQLNLTIPAWTRRSVEQIFATHLEDWPALLRAMRMTAEEARAQNRKLLARETPSPAGQE